MSSQAAIFPMSSLVTPMLTDMYQVSMAYAHWKNGKIDDEATFDLFFRKPPFHGEYCIFAGSDEVVKFIATYKFTNDDISYLKSISPEWEEEFFLWLGTINCSKIKIYSVDEGSLVFPREPLIRVEGPLAIAQLLETTLLNLVNFPSLIATNAARMRLAAGSDKTLLEFGLRRAQGPDGAVSASKYAFVGGFDGTSNVLAGKLTGITVKGTHAHAYVMSYTGLKDLKYTTIVDPKNKTKQIEFLEIVLDISKKIQSALACKCNEGELAAFISYAQASPTGFLALVDTYDTLQSGVPNFIAVAYALNVVGYVPLGIRLDSGDLAYLSKKVREMYRSMDKLFGTSFLTSLQIVASNDINEDVLLSLSSEGHEINTFGIGTHLVTCQRQPALGCVFKLVEINGTPRIKLSQDVEKLVIPCKKSTYRMYSETGHPLMDYMVRAEERAPEVGKRILCRHPFEEQKRAYVTPAKVEPLLKLIWDGENGGIVRPSVTLSAARDTCKFQLSTMRNDHIRPLNPTPYKVAVSQSLYDYMHELWLLSAPISDLK